jgi:hypothetical protein
LLFISEAISSSVVTLARYVLSASAGFPGSSCIGDTEITEGEVRFCEGIFGIGRE